MSNTIEKTSTIKTTVTYSKDEKHRYCLKMEWDSSMPKCAIIMTFPSTANLLQFDQTTMLVLNNTVEHGFGSVSILNLFSELGSDTPKTDKLNSSLLLKECDMAEIIIVAYGRSTQYEERKKEVISLLDLYKEKLYTLQDKNGNLFSHPLSPLARNWNIIKLDTNAK